MNALMTERMKPAPIWTRTNGIMPAMTAVYDAEDDVANQSKAAALDELASQSTGYSTDDEPNKDVLRAIASSCRWGQDSHCCPDLPKSPASKVTCVVAAVGAQSAPIFALLRPGVVTFAILPVEISSTHARTLRCYLLGRSAGGTGITVSA